MPADKLPSGLSGLPQARPGRVATAAQANAARDVLQAITGGQGINVVHLGNRVIVSLAGHQIIPYGLGGAEPSDAMPQSVANAGDAGVSDAMSRGDHEHAAQVPYYIATSYANLTANAPPAGSTGDPAYGYIYSGGDKGQYFDWDAQNFEWVCRSHMRST